MNTEIFKYIFVLGAVQGFMLSLFLFKKKENHTANLIMSALIFAFSLNLLEVFYVTGKYYFDYPHLIGSTFGFPYLYGPAIYIFVLVLKSNKKEFSKKYLLHFIPFLIVFVATAVLLYPQSATYKIALLENKVESLPGEIISSFIPFHGIIYIILTLKAAYMFNKKIKLTFSNIDKINMDWLIYIVTGNVIIWGIVIFSYIVEFMGDKEIMNPGYLIYLGISIYIYIMGYKSLQQPEIQFTDEEINTEVNQNKSYKKSGLTDEKADEYLEKLINYFERESVYKNSELKLTDLSVMLGISSHNLSEVINRKLGKSFYDFVNGYRVDEVKKAILSGKLEKFSMLSIAFEAGFSSKSTFNTTFKKITGMTPTQYKNSLK